MCTWLRPKQSHHFILHPPWRTQLSIIFPSADNAIRSLLHSRASTEICPHSSPAVLDRSKLCCFYPASYKNEEEQHLLTTMKSSTTLSPTAFSITTFSYQVCDRYLVFSSLIFIISLFKPLHLIGFGNSGTTGGVFPPFVCKRCNCNCSPTFCLLRTQITIFQLTVFAFKLSGFYRQHYSYICHLLSA